jgi:hypothetical protein
MADENRKRGVLTVPVSSHSLNLAPPENLLDPENREKQDRALEEMARARRQAEASSQNIRLS